MQVETSFEKRIQELYIEKHFFEGFYKKKMKNFDFNFFVPPKYVYFFRIIKMEEKQEKIKKKVVEAKVSTQVNNLLVVLRMFSNMQICIWMFVGMNKPVF